MTDKQILKTLDYAVLKPDAPLNAVKKAAKLCNALGIKCLCVKSCDVAFARKALGETKVKLAAVVGFPHGNVPSAIKLLETNLAVNDGADEIDMVINIATLKAGKFDEVVADICGVVDAARRKPVKVILETALLTEKEMRLGVRACIEGGAKWVKTSTGFAAHGATPEAVAILLDEAKGSKLQVKASGGIRSREDAERYLTMGCTRLGVGSVEQLIKH